MIGDAIQYADNALDACKGADALILVTEWSEFRHLDLEEIKPLLKGRVLFDGRNIWDPARVRAQGFEYHGIGVR